MAKPRLTKEQKANLKNWIAALRSGKYRQVSEVLKDSDGKRSYGFCCLGVACDLYRKETGKGRWRGSKFYLDGKNTPYDANFDGVKKFFGFVHPTGFTINGSHLAYWNDTGHTFEEIADLVEEHILGVKKK